MKAKLSYLIVSIVILFNVIGFIVWKYASNENGYTDKQCFSYTVKN